MSHTLIAKSIILKERGSVTTTGPFLFCFVNITCCFMREWEKFSTKIYIGKKAEAMAIRPLWHRKVTRSLLFLAKITCIIMRREYKGNYEKPNCKMWSAITFERMIIPIHTLFSFSRD